MRPCVFSQEENLCLVLRWIVSLTFISRTENGRGKRNYNVELNMYEAQIWELLRALVILGDYPGDPLEQVILSL
jgi:hypothetical protein